MPDASKRLDRAELARRIERAEKLLQKGKTADALDEYFHVLTDDPENDTARQVAADLCLSLQRTPEAVKLLGELFERQVTAGESTRASLTYKKLARLVNPSWQQKLRFGQILESSNRKLAIETYEEALKEMAQQGRQRDSLAVLKRLVVLDGSEQNLLRLGELSAQFGQSKDAAAAFMKLAQMTEISGANAAQWYEKAYGEDPSDPEIALAYGKSLLNEGQVGAAIFILEPHVLGAGASPEFRDTYATALLAANRLTEAEPFLWQSFELNPSKLDQVARLIGMMIDAQLDTDAVTLARKLEQFQRRRGDRRAFVALMQDIAATHRASIEVLEFLSELFNASNRETDYSQTLLKMFELHCAAGDFNKAAECFDKAAEVDAYEPGHQKRLEMLRGKIDDNRFKVISSRFSSVGKAAVEPQRENPTLGASALQDLMLQVEILVQYGMRSKAIERLQRIQELFPHEEERNEDLHALYLSAGMTPHYADSAPALGGTASSPVPAAAAPVFYNPAASAPAAVPPPVPATDAADVSSLTRVAEIARKLYKQTHADAVLTTAVNEIGGQWKASRCVTAMRKPGMAPTAVKEFCAEGERVADAAALAKIVSVLHDQTINRGALSLVDAMAVPELAAVHPELGRLKVSSLLALPLADGSEQVGVLVLMQTSPRGWHASDIVVLKTIAEQMVISLNNAGLRRLVKNLSVTDERSGLLKRASYLDLLLAEARRAVQQSTPLTVALMQFGKGPAMAKEHGDAALQAAMRQMGQLFAAHIRQNDLAFRYGHTTVALVLGETGEKEALLAVEKLKKLAGEVRVEGSEEPLKFCSGLAEAVVQENYDPADIVTEVINRAEQALDMAVAQGQASPLALAPKLAAGAVA